MQKNDGEPANRMTAHTLSSVWTKAQLGLRKAAMVMIDCDFFIASPWRVQNGGAVMTQEPTHSRAQRIGSDSLMWRHESEPRSPGGIGIVKWCKSAWRS
jgi:hypothetical protein